jgi:hypothetical protein
MVSQRCMSSVMNRTRRGMVILLFDRGRVEARA